MLLLFYFLLSLSISLAQWGDIEEEQIWDRCRCVPYHKCTESIMDRNGQAFIDIRDKDSSCKKYLEICCNEDNIVQDSLTPKSLPRSGCGYRNPRGLGVEISGERENEAQFGEFPWMVAIFYLVEYEGSILSVYKCGGSLIHPQVVLTAAHCVNNQTTKYYILAGEWDTESEDELYPNQDREVKFVEIHSQFNSRYLLNDVALLFLKSPVQLGNNVGIACLPPPETVTESGRCFVTGWGKDAFGKDGRYNVILKKVDLPMVPRNTCQTMLRKTRLGRFFRLHNSFVCAGGEPGKDACEGDGGSPLVCPIAAEQDRYYQTGIVSWGIGCNNNNIPGVYGNVAYFRNWIDEKMKNHKLETTYYQY